MTSRLPSLLVRDGLLAPTALERVFQQQVIDGGSIDTQLLEMDLVESHRLRQYLSLASGCPLAPAGDPAGDVENDLLKVCNQDTAKKYRVVPVALHSAAGRRGLDVLVADPVDVGMLENLADELDVSVQPMVVPQYQFELWAAHIFAVEAPSRFVELAAKVDSTAVQAGGSESPPVVPKIVLGDIAKRADTYLDESGEHAAVPRAIEPETTKPADTSDRVRGKRAPAEQPERRQTGEFGVDPAFLDPASIQVGEEEPVDPYAPITPDIARKLLSESADRDEIFTILLRALRKRARHALLFTIRGTVATGRMALSRAGLDLSQVKDIEIPLNVPSRFAEVVDKQAFRIGTLSDAKRAVNPECAAGFTALGGGEIPATVLLLPIVLRNRVIAIALAHNGERGISVGRVTELLPLGTATADALSQLLAKKKTAKKEENNGGGGSTPNGASGTTSPENVNPGDASSAKGQRAKPASGPIETEEHSPVPEADAEMIALFARIEAAAEPQEFEVACAEALACKEKSIAHLRFHFPGKLVKERPGTAGNGTSQEISGDPAPADFGPILDLVCRLGPECGEVLAEKMSDANREVRYYATLCAAELRPANVLNELVERLFDGDESIRNLAIRALSSYPEAAVDPCLDFARRALHSEDNGRVKVAAAGLVKLADTKAIPDLIDAHSRGGSAAEVSRHALFLLTNQDFGNSTRKWRAWWEKNQDRHRIDWLLEGLGHKNAEIRKNASETLRSLSGEYFAYGHDLPKKERDKTRKLWMQWWESNRGDWGDSRTTPRQ